MLKKEIRLNFKKLRSRLSAEEVRDINQSIQLLCRSLPIWEFRYYHIFLPIESKNEINTYLIIDSLRSNQKIIIVPKVRNELLLDHLVLEENTELELSQLGIPEPKSGKVVAQELIDVVFVPLLAFDKQGHRVGYGKGYYDRFLSSCRKDTIKVGLSQFEAVDEILDVSPEDILLDYCVTPSKVYAF